MRILVNRYLNIVFVILLISIGANAQVVSDSVKVKADTLKDVQNKLTISKPILKIQDTTKIKPFKPDPMKVVWMGAIIPGYGQILNRKYWKLPIVYGGFLGCAYALTWNGGKYQSYRNAYLDISRYQTDPYYKADVDKNPSIASFIQILPKGTTINSPGINGITTWSNTLKTRQDIFRRYRDLSIIISIGCYALTLVDAYVDAQLYDFDISPDLSLRFQPTLLENSPGTRNTFAMQCCISLK